MDHGEAVRLQATEKYLLGSLSSPVRDQFEEHFFDCEICADDMRTAVFLMDNASAEFRAESGAAVKPAMAASPAAVPSPARPVKTGWRDWFSPAFLRPAFALSAVLLIAVSALWIGDHHRLTRELDLATAPQLITNVPLDTARGEKPVTVVRNERYFAVSFYIEPDEPGRAPQPTYAIQISGPHGPPVTVIAAARSTSYSLLLPVAQYPAARYSFKVFGGAVSGPLVKQFALSLE